MADTFTLHLRDIPFASNKSLLTVFNGSGSGRVLRICRVWCRTCNSAGVSGVLTSLDLRGVTASAGGTTVVPTAHDPTQTALAAQVLCTSGATDTTSAILRRWAWSTDEPAQNAITMDEMQTMPAFSYVWDVGYRDTSVPKLVLREGQGLTVRQAGSNIVGVVDVGMIFTNAAS